MELFMHYLLLCAATGTCAMTVSKMKVAAPLHDLAAKLGQVWLQDLLTCPYCLSVWFGLFWVVATQSISGLIPTIFMGLAVAGGGVLFGGAMYRIMMLHEKEVYALKEALSALREKLADAREERADAEREVMRLQNQAKHYPGGVSIPPQATPPLPPEWSARFPTKSNGFTPPRPMPPATPPAPSTTGDQP